MGNPEHTFLLRNAQGTGECWTEVRTISFIWYLSAVLRPYLKACLFHKSMCKSCITDGPTQQSLELSSALQSVKHCHFLFYFRITLRGVNLCYFIEEDTEIQKDDVISGTAETQPSSAGPISCSYN